MGGGRNRVAADDTGDGEAERRTLLRKRKAGKVSLALRFLRLPRLSYADLWTQDAIQISNVVRYSFNPFEISLSGKVLCFVLRRTLRDISPVPI